MKIDFHNMPKGANKTSFIFRYLLNMGRTWFLFHVKYPWVKYSGFVRVMKQTSFAKRQIVIGHNVQFGQYCNIATDVTFGNAILLAGRVCIIGRNDHSFDKPGQLIWQGERQSDPMTYIEDDVWIGHGSTIIAGVTIGRGSIIAAGSVVNKNVPPCEIWGGVPARKIKDRFLTNEEMNFHLSFLNSKQVLLS